MEKQTTTAPQKEVSTYLFVRSEYKIIKVEYKKVLFVEALADYIAFQMEDDQKIIVHSTMKAVEDKLPSDIFTRVHRSYIINKNKIEVIDNQTVLMGDKTVPIGAHYKDSFYGELNFL